MLSDMPVRSCPALTDVLADLARIDVALIDEVAGPAALITLACSIGTVVPHRDSRPDGVTVIEDRGARSAALAGFTRSGLAPHTDRSGVETPPGLLLTVCGREPAAGGQSLIADGHAVYDDLAETAPAALAALSAPRSALFGGADGHLGSVFAKGPDGVVTIRFRLDSLARFAPAVVPHIPALRAAIQRHTITLPIRARAGYVLNNRRWLHGRLGFEGPRLMYRVTADPLPGSVTAGFHPGPAPNGRRATTGELSANGPLS